MEVIPPAVCGEEEAVGAIPPAVCGEEAVGAIPPAVCGEEEAVGAVPPTVCGEEEAVGAIPSAVCGEEEAVGAIPPTVCGEEAVGPFPLQCAGRRQWGHSLCSVRGGGGSGARSPRSVRGGGGSGAIPSAVCGQEAVGPFPLQCAGRRRQWGHSLCSVRGGGSGAHSLCSVRGGGGSGARSPRSVREEEAVGPVPSAVCGEEEAGSCLPLLFQVQVLLPGLSAAPLGSAGPGAPQDTGEPGGAVVQRGLGFRRHETFLNAWTPAPSPGSSCFFPLPLAPASSHPLSLPNACTCAGYWGGERPEAEAMPAGGGRWGSFWEQRTRQLQSQVRAKEDKIAELETENAVLLLKLAEYKGKIEKSRSEATRISTLYNKQQRLQRNTRSALSQLDRVIQKLNQDIQAFHSSSRALLRDYQDEYQDRVSAIVTAVQRTRQSAETLLVCQAKVVHLEQALQDVSARHQLERQRRKALHNSLVELRGNIRVHCRIRPLLPFDSESDDPVLQSSSISREVAHAVDDETVLVKCDRPGHPLINKTYHFERVYGPAESQSAVFGDVCPLLTSLLDGYNVCVMAYGQTGSGKSYTMLGPHSDDGPVLPLDPQSDLGIIPRAAEELFRLISENPSRSPKVEVSIVEVYNNDIFDLLAKDTVAAVSGVKREVMTAKDGRTEVALLASEAVGSASKLMELVRGGLQLRAKHPTLVHADSSRSHLIITVTLTTAACSDSTADQACSATLPREQTEAGRAGRSRRTSQGASAPQPVPGDPAGRAEQVQARLQLVDLAGSECIGVSGVTGSALRETACINRSLAALADVLGALSEHRSHIPYRNSRLTHLLQDCLGGDAKLLVILCISPSQRHLAQTLQGLGFGIRARQVQRGPARKRPPSSQMEGKRRPD
uniref:Kinesin-like protein n=2 Tax=Macaca mulatta TaxID=9544 RepID=A0A1D5QAI3_MACMU